MGFFAARRMRAQGRHIHASERQDKGLRIGGRKSLSQKKAPPIWRGKTDSLEISQRGKTRIYTKFMSEGKRKTKKMWGVVECNVRKNVAGPVVPWPHETLYCITSAYRMCKA
jgi:hypothetical protein